MKTEVTSILAGKSCTDLCEEPFYIKTPLLSIMTVTMILTLPHSKKLQVSQYGELSVMRVHLGQHPICSRLKGEQSL